MKMKQIDLILVVNGLLSILFFIKNILLIYFSTQENVTILLNELQLETYPQYHTGKSLAELHRRVHKYSLPIPFISLLSFLESIYNIFRVKKIKLKKIFCSKFFLIA
jgi:hypothetical protein